CAAGYWGNKLGKPHTVPCKVTGTVPLLVHLIPAPRATGIVSASVPKKLLIMVSIDDCYTSARGCIATLGNFAKATFDAISKTYSYLTPDLWKECVHQVSLSRPTPECLCRGPRLQLWPPHNYIQEKKQQLHFLLRVLEECK
uniref:Small ribosomal subunit protein uS5 n=1 Tax=Myotis lucifugus TaxID=59463 RepID=G1QFU8_MYOLU